ncbi:MAG: hypothetical protein PF694_06920 [Bacteroidetes bacterium]|jgi:hypothetical protein|nr:hypothetical protein [Bacteroidota bacterium]
MKNKRLIIILLSIVFVMLIPLIAMQFTHQVNWNILDFAIMGILLFGTGIACEIILRQTKNILFRLILCGVYLLTLLLVWAELAVGIFGTMLS